MNGDDVDYLMKSSEKSELFLCFERRCDILNVYSNNISYMGGTDVGDFSSHDLCGDYTISQVDDWGYSIPEGLKRNVLKASKEGFSAIVLENQLQTYLHNTLTFENTSQELQGYIFSEIGKSLLSNWNHVTSENELFVYVHDEEFIAEVLYNALVLYLENGGDVNPEQVIVLGGQDYVLGGYMPYVEDANTLPFLDEIHGRGDVNSLDFLAKVGFTEGRITESDLEEYFSYAFQREFETPRMQERIRLFRDKYEQIFQIFARNITNFDNEETIRTLVFLCIVESSFDSNLVSSAGAVGLWQILPETAEGYCKDGNIQEALKSLDISTDIASRYLNDIIGRIQLQFPSLSDLEILKIALREYNGGWSRKLVPEYRKDVFLASQGIFIELSKIHDINALQISEADKVRQSLDIIAVMQEKYFGGNSDLVSYIKERGYDENMQELISWSHRYLERIVKQQLMYPSQLIGVRDALASYQE